jgi:group I intron endonuclease
MGILYLLTFASGKHYVGVTECKTLESRLHRHRYSAKSGSKLPVHMAWRKHGAPVAEILATFDDDGLYQAEIDEIAKRNTIVPNGYNILVGGQKSPALNPDVAQKIRQATIKRYQDPLQREAASLRAKNRSMETRIKISQALTGKELSNATKEKIRQANIGKTHSEETKSKMSKSHFGKKYSEETLERMRKAARKRMQSPGAKAQLKAASLAGGKATQNKAKAKT